MKNYNMTKKDVEKLKKELSQKTRELKKLYKKIDKLEDEIYDANERNEVYDLSYLGD